MTGPSIALSGLPTFNAGDPAFKITAFDGWWATAKPRAEILPSGVVDGAVAVGPWDFAEAYYTLTGVIRSADRATLMGYRRALLAALPANEDATVVVHGNDEDVDLQISVRRYDAPDIRVVGNNLLFTVPLVAVDPFKYADILLADEMTTFTGATYYLAPSIVGGYAIEFDTADYTLTFDTDAAEGIDQAAVLVCEGDATSRRLTFAVTGPLNEGDWFLLHEQTGDRLYLDRALTATQTVTFDCYRQTATLNGNSVDTEVFGDYLTLLPGSNTYRLISGTETAGSATVQGRPAYQ